MRAATLPDIVCRRGSDGTAVVEGFRHDWIWHSPTGFEWGYGGSGPADLELNILLAATADRDFAARHHQSFKWRFLAALPRSGGTIRAGDGEGTIRASVVVQLSSPLGAALGG